MSITLVLPLNRAHFDPSGARKLRDALSLTKLAEVPFCSGVEEPQVDGRTALKTVVPLSSFKGQMPTQLELCILFTFSM
jgi:hypothetical protein